jgi:hypothetical protein
MSFPVASYVDLLLHLGMAKISLCYCPVCYPEALASSLATSPRYLWAVTLFCGRCGLQWIVCKECSNNRKHLHTPMDVLQHNQSKRCYLLSKNLPSSPSTRMVLDVSMMNQCHDLTMGALTSCYDYSLFNTSSNLSSRSYGSPMRVLSDVALPSLACYHSSSPTYQCIASTSTVNDCHLLLAFVVSNNSVREVDSAPNHSVDNNFSMKESTVMDDCPAPNDTILTSACNVEKCYGDDRGSSSAVECSDDHPFVFDVNKSTTNADVASTSPPVVSNTSLPTSLQLTIHFEMNQLLPLP